MPTMEKEIATAVRWWSDILQDRSPRKFDNGDRSFAGAMTMMLATQLDQGAAVADDQFTAFEAALTRLLAEQANAGRTNITLATDYGPGGILADAMEEAGVSFNKAPYKTCMWLEPDLVTVSAGYRAPTETLYIVARAEMRFLDFERLGGKEVTKQYINVERALNEADSAIRYRNERENSFYSLPLGGKNLETGEPLTLTHVVDHYKARSEIRLAEFDRWADPDRAQPHRKRDEESYGASLAAFLATEQAQELIGDNARG